LEDTVSDEKVRESYLLQFFVFAHLASPEARKASEPFAVAATAIAECRFVGEPFEVVLGHVKTLPENPERTMALNKLGECGFAYDFRGTKAGDEMRSPLRLLLEAKDCAVRASFYKEPTP
jgi:hypothetical protein